jgi:hypothetical protein
MKEELLKELYTSIESVNKILLDDELTDYAKQILIKEEEAKQIRLRQFLQEWTLGDLE